MAKSSSSYSSSSRNKKLSFTTYTNIKTVSSLPIPEPIQQPASSPLSPPPTTTTITTPPTNPPTDPPTESPTGTCLPGYSFMVDENEMFDGIILGTLIAFGEDETVEPGLWTYGDDLASGECNEATFNAPIPEPMSSRSKICCRQTVAISNPVAFGGPVLQTIECDERIQRYLTIGDPFPFYQIELSSTPNISISTCDSDIFVIISLFDSAGTRLFEATVIGCGRGEQVSYLNLPDGVYYVQIVYGPQPGLENRYELEIKCTASVDDIAAVSASSSCNCDDDELLRSGLYDGFPYYLMKEAETDRLYVKQYMNDYN